MQNQPPPAERSGLVLDYFLSQIQRVRRQFELEGPTFDLAEIERQPRCRDIVEGLTKATVARHGCEIFFKDQLLGDVAEKTLRMALAMAMQTIVQLPARHQKPVPISRKAKPVAARLSSLADEMKVLLLAHDLQERVRLLEVDISRLRRAIDELRWASATLISVVSSTQIRKIRTDSPNPQISFALFMIGWIEACTGTKRYEELQILIAGAFAAAGANAPKWVERLAIEMCSKRKFRKQWIQSISS
jgi:hypothetical protein